MGSEPVRVPGARFLPIPADGDLEVGAESVAGFLGEVALLRGRHDAIAESTQRTRGLAEHREELVRRLWNLEVAALPARVIGGGVIVR
ncbi:hypothetical protein [Streptomyces violaceus]|uniref:Uncharacterized protein n=1 Tax=Streptomyces violaceus TaxID=1936 RepID=A0ABY9U517_STRVL|nr:hypothetical protein [Streptomyces janthinus]WND17943.1 hypothetical protein RI060_11585 [Streptomyces janthinus]GGS83554.1 hypothetical protein GCM10010270_64520 [Streptomyces janthinus]